MKKKLLLLMMLCVLSSLCHAQKYLNYDTSTLCSSCVTSPDVSVEKVSDGVIVTYNFHGALLTKDSQYSNAYHWNIDGFVENCGIGEPAYLKKIDRIYVPSGMNASVSLIDSSVKSFKYELAPSRQITSNSNNGANGNVEPISSYSGYIPDVFGEVSGLDSYRGHNILNVVLYPIRYEMSSKTVFAYTSLKYKVTFVSKGTRGNVSDSNVKKLNDDIFLKDVLNVPAGVVNSSSSLIQNYLIITSDKYLDNVKRFANWKHNFGFRTFIESKEKWTRTEIKNAVLRHYKENSIQYLLIVGNYNDVPGAAPRTTYIHYHYDYDKEDYRNDPYYSINDYTYCCVDGDDEKADIYRGRITIDNNEELTTVFDKIINYEKNPVENSEFYKRALHCAYFEDKLTIEYGKTVRTTVGDGQEDCTFVTNSEEIIGSLSNQNYSFIRAYAKDSWKKTPAKFCDGKDLPDYLKANSWDAGGNDIANAINNGVVYALYRGHGTVQGWYNPQLSVHLPLLIKNGNKTPIIFSMTCLTGHYTDKCFAGKFMRLKDCGGAIGVFASYEESFSTPSDLMSKEMITSMFVNTLNPGYRLGQILDVGLNAVEVLDDKSLVEYTKETYHLFGDPSLRVNTKFPDSFGDVTVDNDKGKVTVRIWNGKKGQITLIDDENGDLQSVIGSNCTFTLKNPKSYTARICVSGYNMKPLLFDVESYANEPVLIVSQEKINEENFYNKLTVGCKMDGQRGTLTIYRKTGINSEIKETRAINKDDETFVFDTEFWTAGDYSAEIQYNGKKVVKDFSLNPSGLMAKVEASVDASKNIDVKFKFTHGVSVGELRLYKYSDVQTGFSGVTPIKTYNVDYGCNGKYSIYTESLETDNYTIALFENNNCVALSDLFSESGVVASIYKNMSMLNVYYQLFPITRDAYIEVLRNPAEGRIFAPISDKLLGAIRSIDVDNGLSGGESFYYTNWYDGDYTVKLYQNGKETACTSISISPLGSLVKVSKTNNYVYITYEISKSAKSAYVVINDLEGTRHYEQKISLSSSDCSVRGNFSGCKFVEVTLFVDGIPVSSKTVR